MCVQRFVYEHIGYRLRVSIDVIEDGTSVDAEPGKRAGRVPSLMGYSLFIYKERLNEGGWTFPSVLPIVEVFDGTSLESSQLVRKILLGGLPGTILKSSINLFVI
jgi:hypothetical protein